MKKMEHSINAKGEQISIYYQDILEGDMGVASIVDTSKLKKWASKPLELAVVCMMTIILILMFIKFVFFKTIINEMVSLLYEKNDKLLESTYIYEMLFNMMNYHIYQIDTYKKEITHKGNLFDRIENKCAYETMEEFYRDDQVEIMEYKELVQIHKELLSGMIQSEAVDFQMRRLGEETYKWYNLQIQAIQDAVNGGYKILGFIMDIDARKEKE